MLHRFWFTFERSSSPSVLNLGCGVTAYDIADAKNLIEEQIFPAYGKRNILNVIADIDVTTLDENHVRPNMTSPAIRGIWFPRL